MTNQHLIYIYFVTLLLIAINVIFVLTKKYKLIKYTSVLATISAGSAYVGAYLVSGHLPVYDKFATIQNIVFIVIILGLIYNRKAQNKDKSINILWFFVLALQLFVLTQKMEVTGDYYMYDKSYVILFFQLRITSIGFFVFAMINLVASIINKSDFKIQDLLIHRARNFTILGSIVFLLGEFSGSYWCFLWWGDPWHWSKGFFIASVMFLLSMLSSHLPFNLANTKLKKTIYSLIALCLILTTYLLPH
ncbi:MAG: hypothetical protein JEY96_03870 [Bacteroidales bacterium]|nr:hypothetical protein [Bacteroidales bacterium]